MTASPETGPIMLLVATTKGAWTLTSDVGRSHWQVAGPTFLGHTIHHIVQDPREPSRMLMAARTGHLGPTVFRSADGGRNWTEATHPPAFDKVPEGETGRVVDHVFWLTPGHASEPGAWYAGTSPQGLFRSTNHGASWEPVSGFNDNPMWRNWTGGEQDGTPDGPKMHSVLVDPRDKRHLYLGMSSGGVFESTDAGANWQPLNRGSLALFLPDPNPEYGQDPHCVLQHPANPDILYQQNHCGIYRMDRREGAWKRIGEAMPAEVGDIGFPIVAHPRDARTVWVFPMDGSDVWPRVSPGGHPAAYVTRDAGETWQRQDRGLPPEQGWFTVKRQAMATDSHGPVGVYFGTTGGEIWASVDEGEHWRCIASHLPQVYAVSVARPA
ncbi:Glycosyl hydrolase [Cupriavidus oxalaticus]|uniref:glycosyl hydrolase n=1 Tax=Cupriavidus oxalaticus TaxID=96344 RepID=UPI003F73B8EA